MPSSPLPRRSALAWLAAGALPWPAMAQGTGTLQSWKLATSRRTGIHDVAPAASQASTVRRGSGNDGMRASC